MMRFNRVGEEKEGKRQMDRDKEGRIGVGWGEKRRRVNSGEGSLHQPRVVAPVGRFDLS